MSVPRCRQDSASRQRWGFALATLFAAIVGIQFCRTSAAGDEGNNQSTAWTLEPTVKTLLEQRCLECHNPEDSNGGIDFSNAATLFAMADSGRAPVVAAEPENSELLTRLRSSDDDLRMPPDGPPLSKQEIHQLEAWISKLSHNPFAGHQPADEPFVKSDHWSFQPIQEPTIPAARATDWNVSSIDSFLQVKREQRGLVVTNEASPETLMRRAFFALTGLPPTQSDRRKFLADIEHSGSLEVAFSTLVDDLLSRRTYGERWGRHWMDWVRYADTAGDNSDFPIPQAYLYRNYIIDSFNNDIPYDQFIREQIAGDLMPAASQQERNRQVIATGYLAMARRFGSLVETYPWHLTIEDTIDNVGRTMLGLTISCARCHDHKFDPISTRDYYGLYGIFGSTQYAFPGIELFQVQHDLVPLVPENEVQQIRGEYDAETVRLEKVLADLLAKSRQRELEDAERASSVSIAEQRRRRDELEAMQLKARKAGEKLADHLKAVPAVPDAYAVQDGTIADARIHIKGEPTRLGATVPRRFPEILGGQPVLQREQSGRLELASWLTSPQNPLTARVIVNRVWQRHFGRGLVDSTSDFGTRGSVPSHPALLDWLASDFMHHGWSLKRLHRQIMGTRAYRLSSQLEINGESESALVHNQRSDPENRLLWKFPRHRLDAESIRDAILFISHQLDQHPQDEPYAIPAQKDWEYTQHHPFKDDYPSPKRSVYQMTKRLTVGSYMQTFDGADPNVCTSSRDESVTALQALYFVNDEFLHAGAERYAELLEDRTTDSEARVRDAFLDILGRLPSEQEQQWLMDHLTRVRERIDGSPEDAERLALASLVRSLFRLNEFLYID